MCLQKILYVLMCVYGKEGTKETDEMPVFPVQFYNLILQKSRDNICVPNEQQTE